MKTLPATHHDLFDKYGCKLCGMPKSVDIETGVRHLDWHIYVLSIAGIASDAESTASMLRPIGPGPGAMWPPGFVDDDKENGPPY